MIDCLDLGCGTGASTAWAKHAIGWDTQLGLNNRSDEVEIATANGYNVRLQDITTYEPFDRCRYVVSFHCLEHLRSESEFAWVMQKAVSAASEFVFVKVPFFETKKLNELKDLGLRLTWTNWTGHPTPVTIDMIERTLAKIGVSGKTGHLIPMLRTSAECVIPYDSPVDTVRYSKELGEKKIFDLDGFYLETYCFVPISPDSIKVFERLIDPVKNIRLM